MQGRGWVFKEHFWGHLVLHKYYDNGSVNKIPYQTSKSFDIRRNIL